MLLSAPLASHITHLRSQPRLAQGRSDKHKVPMCAPEMREPRWRFRHVRASAVFYPSSLFKNRFKFDYTPVHASWLLRPTCPSPVKSAVFVLVTTMASGVKFDPFGPARGVGCSASGPSRRPKTPPIIHTSRARGSWHTSQGRLHVAQRQRAPSPRYPHAPRRHTSHAKYAARRDPRRSLRPHYV